MKKTKYLKYLSLIIGTILVMSLSFPAYAQEKADEDKSIIFLLDTSGSMKTNDPERLAIDSIAQLIYTLPTNYRVGLVAYSSEMTVKTELVDNSSRSEIMKAAESVDYNGYSNAGVGLQCAVDFLKEDAAKEKYIILLSDGEILMDDDAVTKESLQNYKNAIQQAKNEDITIHVIGLGKEMEDMDNEIFAAADETGGSSYYTSQAANIQAAVDSVLDDDLQIKQSTVAIVDADGSTETVSMEMPFTYADKLRILLTSDSEIRNLKTNFQADNARQINGTRYSLIEIDKPANTKLEMSFAGAPGSQIRVNVIPEYHVVPAVEVQYQDDLPPQQNARYFRRTAQISYMFLSADNKEIQLWNTDYFNYNKIPVSIGTEVREMSLNKGKLESEQEVENSYGYEAHFDYSKLPFNVIGMDTVLVELEGPPLMPIEEPQEEENSYVFMVLTIIGFLAIAIIFALLIVKMSRKKPIPQPPEDRPEPGKYGYIGKLNIYITRTQSGYDIPPLSYNLFRLPAGRVISMQEILSDCSVDEKFQGAESIYFKAGANRSLILTNNSDCTIIKNREILMKKKSYQLLLEAKVDITFEDEISELTFQYKDLKPSEK